MAILRLGSEKCPFNFTRLARSTARVGKDKKDKVSEKELEAAWGVYVDAQMHDQLQDAKPELEQTWFPGVHINVGGGSKDPLGERKAIWNVSFLQ